MSYGEVVWVFGENSVIVWVVCVVYVQSSVIVIVVGVLVLVDVVEFMLVIIGGVLVGGVCMGMQVLFDVKL